MAARAMEIIFLFVGIIFIGVGGAICLSDVMDRRGTDPVPARVIGFSMGRSDNPNGHFHSVAQYQGSDGHNYYIEGSIGSSVPLHSVGQSVTVLVDSLGPERAVLQSRLPFAFGTILALMGLAFAIVFWVTFRVNVFSLAAAAVVSGAFAFKIRNAWRKKPLSMGEWREYKKQLLAPRVFTDQSKDQITWAEPTRLQAAIRSQKKSNRFAIPLLLAGGVGLLFLSHHFYVKTEAFLAKANHTSGRVVDLHETDSSDASTTYAPVVEFSDPEGRSHTFVDSLSSSPPSYRIGDKVGVLYNRDNIREAQIDRGRGNYWLTIVLACLGALALVLGVFSARQSRLLV